MLILLLPNGDRKTDSEIFLSPKYQLKKQKILQVLL